MKNKFQRLALISIQLSTLILVCCNKEKDEIVTQFDNVTDIDGNTYKIGLISNQWWFFEDLKVTKYNDGVNISDGTGLIPNNINETAPRYFFTHSNGKFYTWYVTADTCEVCPSEWHAASKEEWDILIDFLGGFENAGAKLKEIGFITDYNGMYGYDGIQTGMDTECDWWTATQDESESAITKTIFQSRSNIPESSANIYYGLSIRCIKNN
jgi:uncharacterized protein (TIGR02145 family)